MAEKLKAKKGKVYKMPEKIAKGEKLTSTNKIDWMIKDSIGIGGFGEIYAGVKVSEPNKVRYAIKIEPHENGPLFCERTVYANIGKESDVKEFCENHNLKRLGLPMLHGFGSHKYKGKDYRFIVIDKFRKDLMTMTNNRPMPYDTILKVSTQILYVLKYMHSKGYVHCDVKGANLLLGEVKGTENQVYLVDLGLACKYKADNTPNPKKAHNGTLEFTSRDAHRGVMTRRGDLEILGYNMIYWATGALPWLELTDPVAVQKLKEQNMASTATLLRFCYKTDTPHPGIKQFMTNVSRMDALEEPDYDKLLDIFAKELKKLKTDPNKLFFGNIEVAKSPKKKATATPARKTTRTARTIVPETPETEEEESQEEKSEVEDSFDFVDIEPKRAHKRKILVDDNDHPHN